MNIDSTFDDVETHARQTPQLQAPGQPASAQHACAGSRRMKTDRFDQVSSFLMALIVFTGSAVAMLFLAWMLTPQQPEHRSQLSPITSVTFGSSNSLEQNFEEPAENEIQELVEPTLEQTVQEIAELPSNTKASAPASGFNGTGKSKGTKGDQLQAGPEGAPVVPAHLRWELRFKAGSEKEFASQLEHLKIELGAFGGGVNGIDYVGAPFDKSSARKSDDPTAEKRLYFSWNRRTPLQGYERSLVKRAGIVSDRRHLVKFISPELEKSLADKELEYAQNKGVDSVTDIVKTVFECQAVGSTYDFVVIDQRYQPGRQKSAQQPQKSP